jgi:acyl dehydratase
MTRYFEDLEVGDVYELDATYEVTETEVKEFAEKYDPQPFHLDEEAAQDSIFGSLAASGWHTASMCMRLLVDGFLEPEASMGARGVDELRWKQPVYPGDTLHGEVEVVEKRDSESRPELGHIETELRGYNQDDELVIRWIGLGMQRKRNPGE